MLRILTYHRIADPEENPDLDPSLISATPEGFARQLEFLARSYRVISVDDVLDALEKRRPIPPRAILIIFDDGYRDFDEHAWPILKRYGFPVALFVSTSYPGNPGRFFWWDRLYHAMTFTPHRAQRDALLGAGPESTQTERLALLRQFQNHIKTIPHAKALEQIEIITKHLEVGPPRSHGILTWPELRRLSQQGVVLGAHTRTHPILTQMPQVQMREEIRGSQDDLAREIQSVKPIFCYPSGAHNDQVVRIVREEGFKVAFTTLDGHNDLCKQDPLRLFRTNITCRTTPTILRVRLWPGVSYLDRIRHSRKGQPFIVPPALREEY